MFGAVKLTKNTDFNKYKYSGYGIGFDAPRSFSLSDGSGFGKNVIIFDVDIPNLGKGPTQKLDDTTMTAEKEYAINFSEQQKKHCLSLHYNGVNSYLFVNRVEIYKFKAKYSEINAALLCLCNVFQLII